MQGLFKKYKKEIDDFLYGFLREKQKDLSKINLWGPDVAKRFLSFIDKGKTVRGGLVVLAYEMSGKKIDKNSLAVASAMEILHSSLLIHDDIMDRDVLRRGAKTIHAQYREVGKKEKIFDTEHFGESLGICAADIGFFWVFELLSRLEVKDDIRQRLVELFAKESVYTGLGQMQDVYLGFSKKEIKEQKILDIYLYKTAHYTFSLPLTAGAILAGQKPLVISKLTKLGEYLGTVFQIKDDELGIFGSEREIGKAVGRDIKENKKTLYWLYLMHAASKVQKRRLSEIFGKQSLSGADINYVRSLIKTLGVDKLINIKLDDLIDKTTRLIKSLPVSKIHKNFLLSFLEYSTARTK